jgi:hypothetical protein
MEFPLYINALVKGAGNLMTQLFTAANVAEHKKIH